MLGCVDHDRSTGRYMDLSTDCSPHTRQIVGGAANSPILGLSVFSVFPSSKSPKAMNLKIQIIVPHPVVPHPERRANLLQIFHVTHTSVHTNERVDVYIMRASSNR